MNVLFVHGMGRTPLSGLPVLLRLRMNGLTTSTFGYSTALHDFDAISKRLSRRICQISERGEYMLIGHSLGGVLIRQAIHELPSGVKRPQHVFLLGSPVHSARLANKLKTNMIYRALTGDCGALLASKSRMEQIAPLRVPSTSIVGVKGLMGKFSPFGHEKNDGVVAVSETRAEWIGEEVQVPVIHTLLPASGYVADVILSKLISDGAQ